MGAIVPGTFPTVLSFYIIEKRFPFYFRERSRKIWRSTSMDDLPMDILIRLWYSFIHSHVSFFTDNSFQRKFPSGWSPAGNLCLITEGKFGRGAKVINWELTLLVLRSIRFFEPALSLCEAESGTSGEIPEYYGCIFSPPPKACSESTKTHTAGINELDIIERTK